MKAKTIPEPRTATPQPVQPAAVHAEIARLTDCLNAANASAEKFEREWYLRGDEIEAMRAQLLHLDAKEIRDLSGAVRDLTDQPLAVFSDVSILNICSLEALMPLRQAGDLDNLLILFARTIIAAQQLAKGMCLLPIEPTPEIIAKLFWGGDMDVMLGHAEIASEGYAAYRSVTTTAAIPASSKEASDDHRNKL